LKQTLKQISNWTLLNTYTSHSIATNLSPKNAIFTIHNSLSWNERYNDIILFCIQTNQANPINLTKDNHFIAHTLQICGIESKSLISETCRRWNSDDNDWGNESLIWQLVMKDWNRWFDFEVWGFKLFRNREIHEVVNRLKT